MKYNKRDNKGRFTKEGDNMIQDVLFILGIMGLMLLLASLAWRI